MSNNLGMTLFGEDVAIFDEKSTESAEYERYRLQYRNEHGVFPELDKIHNPKIPMIHYSEMPWPHDGVGTGMIGMAKESGKMVGSLGRGVLDMFTGDVFGGLRKIGEGAGHAFNTAATGLSAELPGEFKKRFWAIIKEYKYLYSLAFSNQLPTLEQLAVWADSNNIQNGSHINNGLGYYWNDENPIYFEGTFDSEGYPAYGYMFNLQKEGATRFFGEFHKGYARNGIILNIDEFDEEFTGIYGFGAGSVDGEWNVDGEECVSWNIIDGIASLGGHHMGLPHGMAIVWHEEGNTYAKSEYCGGEYAKGLDGVKSGMSAIMDSKSRMVKGLFNKFKK